MVKVKRIREKRLAKEKGKRWAGGSGTPENVELPRGETGGIRGGITNVTDPEVRVAAVNRARAREGLPLVAPPEDIPKPTGTPTPIPEEREIERNIFGLATPEERERLLEERKARGSEFDIFKEQLPWNRGEGFGGTMKEVGKDILEAGAAASIPISAGKKIYGAGKAAKEAAAGAEVISPELKGILDFLGSGKKETAKVIEELNKAKVINRLKGITGITPKAAEGIYKAALPNKPRMLMSMAKNLSPAKKVIAGLTLFGTTYYAQSQIFWASADNVATAGSMGANALLSLVTFQDPSPEVVEARKETIMRAMEESGTAMWWASFINPVTAYPLYLFYKKTVLDTANEYVQDRFGDIDMIMANKAAGG